MDRLVPISPDFGFCHSVCLAQERAPHNGKFSLLDLMDLCCHWEHVSDLPEVAGAPGAC